MRSKPIHVKISSQMLQYLDEAAKTSMQTRSAFIREAIALRLKQQYIGQNPDPVKELEAILNKVNV